MINAGLLVIFLPMEIDLLFDDAEQDSSKINKTCIGHARNNMAGACGIYAAYKIMREAMQDARPPLQLPLPGWLRPLLFFLLLSTLYP